jgi:hypothetical protein
MPVSISSGPESGTVDEPLGTADELDSSGITDELDLLLLFGSLGLVFKLKDTSLSESVRLQKHTDNEELQ